jgi:ribosomal protein L7/L12
MSSNLSDDDIEPIRAALRAGNKIEAIKLYRQATGAGLAEAKRFVEAFDPDAPIGSHRTAGSLSDADIEQIQAALFAGKKIEAIKLYRAGSGEGLREAKEFVEALETELRRTEPTRFTAPPAKGCGLPLAVAALVLLGLLNWVFN